MAATTNHHGCCEIEECEYSWDVQGSFEKIVLCNGLEFWGWFFGLQIANYSFLTELKVKGKRCEPSITPLKFFQSSNLNKLMSLAQLI